MYSGGNRAGCYPHSGVTGAIIRSGAVFRSKGSPLNLKDLCDFQLEVDSRSKSNRIRDHFFRLNF